MEFQSKSYNSDFSKPNPKIFFDKSAKSLVITSCWGHNVDTEPVVETIQNFYNSKLKDKEFTSPFAKLDHLDFYENTLRTAILMANQNFFKKVNSEELISGLEIFVLTKHASSLYIGQIGQPHIFLKRGLKTNLVSTEPDLASEYINEKFDLPPLPNKLFGTNKSVDIKISKIHCKNNDQIILLKRSQVFPFDFTSNIKKADLDNISSQLVTQNENLPFWLGILNIE